MNGLSRSIVRSRTLTRAEPAKHQRVLACRESKREGLLSKNDKRTALHPPPRCRNFSLLNDTVIQKIVPRPAKSRTIGARTAKSGLYMWRIRHGCGWTDGVEGHRDLKMLELLRCLPLVAHTECQEYMLLSSESWYHIIRLPMHHLFMSTVF